MEHLFIKKIAEATQIDKTAIRNTIILLNEGCTIPFIARYRKEKTGSLDEVQINDIKTQYNKFNEIQRRKETICKTIEVLGKMTDELRQKIEACWDANVLEDIYLPYKPKRRTKAQIARENGLEPLAKVILTQKNNDIITFANKFKNENIKTSEETIQGAKDIIAEQINENEIIRSIIRKQYSREAVITSKVIKSKETLQEALKFKDYFDFSEPLKRCSGNRLLAMMRGEKEGILKIKITIDDQSAIEKIGRKYLYSRNECSKLVKEAIEDSYKRLLTPSIENETLGLYKQKADEEAIEIFAKNLRELLLAAPLGEKRVMGVDPGIRTGCKVVCLDAEGNLLYHDVVYPFPTKGNKNSAKRHFEEIANKFDVEAIAVGNGTASRETTDILKEAEYEKSIPVFVVNEDGASIYSASKIGREEFPNEDVTVRGAVSIGRRLMDPLAELVKIDPKSIGVGQYQHDVDQKQLKNALDSTVVSCVNLVGVNLNTASQHLLMYVSGLGETIARNIIEYRKENGAFKSRLELKKVPRLGPSAFQQCAGFLRIPNAKNPLDNSAVHPECYRIVEEMAKDNNCRVKELIENNEVLTKIDLSHYITEEIGLPTLKDIINELSKPGRDPREGIEVFEFAKDIRTFEDVTMGMILPGIVTNITKFGAFVDIGVHHDGLVHISQLSNHFINDPTEFIRLHQHVRVKVIGIDEERKRISLSMKDVE